MAEENFQEDEISELFSYAIPKHRANQSPTPIAKQRVDMRKHKLRVDSRLFERNYKCQEKVEQMRAMYK